MAEHESIQEATVAPTAQTASAEKPWLYGQTPSMWFLITSGAVLLIVVIMRLTA